MLLEVCGRVLLMAAVMALLIAVFSAACVARVWRPVFSAVSCARISALVVGGRTPRVRSSHTRSKQLHARCGGSSELLPI